jgi:hypothetical protein
MEPITITQLSDLTQMFWSLPWYLTLYSTIATCLVMFIKAWPLWIGMIIMFFINQKREN